MTKNAKMGVLDDFRIVNELNHTISTKHLKMRFGSDGTDLFYRNKRVKLSENG